MTVGDYIKAASEVAGLIAGGGTLVLGYLTYRFRTIFATKEEVAEVKKQTDANSKAITQLETAIENLPDAETVNQLRLAVSDLRGEIRELRATSEGYKDALDRTTAATTRIEQFLISKGK